MQPEENLRVAQSVYFPDVAPLQSAFVQAGECNQVRKRQKKRSGDAEAAATTERRVARKGELNGRTRFFYQYTADKKLLKERVCTLGRIRVGTKQRMQYTLPDARTQCTGFRKSISFTWYGFDPLPKDHHSRHVVQTPDEGTTDRILAYTRST